MLDLGLGIYEIDSLPVDEDEVTCGFFENLIRKYGYGVFHFSIDNEIAQWAEDKADDTYRQIAGLRIRGRKVKYRIKKIIGQQSLSDGYYCCVYSY